MNQHSDPVEGATVMLSLLDNPDEDSEDPGNIITHENDLEGKFSVRKLGGIPVRFEA